MVKKRYIKHRRWLRGIALIGAIALLVGSLLQADLAYSQTTRLTLSPQFSPNPTQMKGVGGGSTDIKALIGRSDSPTGPCTGYANMAPNHSITLRAFFNSLKVTVESEADTALIIQGPGGTWCNDDTSGKNPEIMGKWLPGKYDIWVTTYSKDKTAPYLLKLFD